MHNLSNLFTFHQRNEGPSCLKVTCGCVHPKIYKNSQATFLNNFLKSKVLKNPTLMLLREGSCGPQTSFSQE